VSVPEAVLRARSVDRLAAMALAVARAGGTPTDLPAADLAELPDLGGGFTVDTAWRHEVATLGTDR
jgi:3,4-dihydroxyphthalate decarboxylase